MTDEKEQTAEATVQLILNHVMEKKGEDISVIDLRGVSGVSDFFILVTGSTGIHLKAIADEVREKMKNEYGVKPWHVEGYEAQKWILVDYVDVVLHVFDRETREYYSLENLWKDAEVSRIETSY